MAYRDSLVGQCVPSGADGAGDEGQWGLDEWRAQSSPSGCPSGALGPVLGGEHRPGVAGSSEFTRSTRRHGFNMRCPTTVEDSQTEVTENTVTSLWP